MSVRFSIWVTVGRIAWVGLLIIPLAAALPHGARPVHALGDDTRVALTGLVLGERAEPLPTARRRIAWEVHRRTSVEMLPTPPRVHAGDATLFESPLIYLAGDRALPSLSGREISALRRFILLGGMWIIDDSSGGESEEFDRSVRELLASVLPGESLIALPASHPIYHSFYLLERPVGRVLGPPRLEAIVRDGRAAVVYSRHDLGGAWARDNLGGWQREVVPGGGIQREQAIRLGVNLVLYALCLDYKDDQVHAPFLMRRHGPLRPTDPTPAAGAARRP